jgi:hypothetical protein
MFGNVDSTTNLSKKTQPHSYTSAVQRGNEIAEEGHVWFPKDVKNSLSLFLRSERRSDWTREGLFE